MALARIVNLHNKWVRYSPKGAMSDECQDLNALHSLVVDGGSVKIPERLTRIPADPEAPFILDQLRDAAKEFHDEFMNQTRPLDAHDVHEDQPFEELLVNLLTAEKLAVSEYELAMMGVRFAEKHGIDIQRHLTHIDFSAFTAAEKHAFSFKLGLTPQNAPFMWNRYILRSIVCLLLMYARLVSCAPRFFIPKIWKIVSSGGHFVYRSFTVRQSKVVPRSLNISARRQRIMRDASSF